MTPRLPLAAIAAAAGLLAIGCGSTKSTADNTTTTKPAVTKHATSAPADIVAAPTHIAHTADGAVGYREVGSGPPLVLITGFGASMDDWEPAFIDALGVHFRVVVFDNAGVGQTAALAAPLSATKMAAQTSALITTLSLGRCDVLGWSMGGMVAQALAATHPDQVQHLVLAATQAGTGKAKPVPAQLQAELDSGNPLAALAVLFPAADVSAIKAYVSGIQSYAGFYSAGAAARQAQETAVSNWFAGADASGRDPASIHTPTLVADGSQDVLDPASNDRMLARLIPGAHLVLYPGAGHAFLFQDQTAFLAELQTFLG